MGQQLLKPFQEMGHLVIKKKIMFLWLANVFNPDLFSFCIFLFLHIYCLGYKEPLFQCSTLFLFFHCGLVKCKANVISPLKFHTPQNDPLLSKFWIQLIFPHHLSPHPLKHKHGSLEKIFISSQILGQSQPSQQMLATASLT